MRLVLNLGEWKFLRVVSALVASLAAVSLFTVLVGFVLLPADMQAIRQPLYASILHSQANPASGQAVSLVWYMPLDATQGWRHQLVRHGMAGERPEVQLVWPEIRPSSATGGKTANELYVGCWDGKLWKVDLSGSGATPKQLGKHPELGPHLIASSPDGRWLASLGPKWLQVLDLASGRVAWSLERGTPRCFAIHPDNQRMLVNSADGQVVELELATGQVRRTMEVQCECVTSATFSPDGRLAVIASTIGSIHLLDWETGASAWPAGWRDFPHDFRSGIAKFSPSGDRLITGGSDTMTLAVWNLRTMRLEGELRGHVKSINGVTFLDEQRVCSYGADGTIRVWDLAGRSPPRVLTIDVTPQAG